MTCLRRYAGESAILNIGGAFVKMGQKELTPKALDGTNAMAVTVNLTNRQQRVLWATVRHYIATAEPVGSKALSEEYDLSVSPATIRNVMGMLEKSGLLYQPHTSAGRVPSDSGYRIYVDQLIQPSGNFPRHMEQVFGERLRPEDWSLEALLREAAQILSNLSGYITLVTFPNPQTAYLRHLQLVLVDPDRVMLIVVTDAYQTQSTVLALPKLPDGTVPDGERVEQELHILSNFLNSCLRGHPLTALTDLDWGDLGQEFARYADSLLKSFGELGRRCQRSMPAQILVTGVSEVLRQPEFSELQSVQTLIHLLEDEQDQLWPQMFEAPALGPSNKRVMVWIGSENPLAPMQTCSLIASTYRRGEVPIGSVGMIGPTRMAYEEAIAAVEATANYLSEALS